MVYVDIGIVYYTRFTSNFTITDAFEKSTCQSGRYCFLADAFLLILSTVLLANAVQ